MPFALYFNGPEILGRKFTGFTRHHNLLHELTGLRGTREIYGRAYDNISVLETILAVFSHCKRAFNDYGFLTDNFRCLSKLLRFPHHLIGKAPLVVIPA
jgi:hypothetical protein